VAHTFNPSYSGGRDQEDHSSEPTQANSSQDPILKKAKQKRAGGVDQVQTPVLERKERKGKKDYLYNTLLFKIVTAHWIQMKRN
jgi:hypothetical protein